MWKTQQWPQDWKWSVFIPIPKKGNAKESSNYCTIALISHSSKVMLKILQARLQQYANCELPDIQVGLEKAEEPEIKLSTSAGSWKKQWPQDWKRSVFIPIPKKGNAKESSNYCTIALILHTSKVMLKILQARLQQYMKCELPDVQAGFRKGRGTRDHIANIPWIIKKARVPEKHLFPFY